MVEWFIYCRCKAKLWWDYSTCICNGAKEADECSEIKNIFFVYPNAYVLVSAKEILKLKAELISAKEMLKMKWEIEFSHQICSDLKVINFFLLENDSHITGICNAKGLVNWYIIKSYMGVLKRFRIFFIM